MMKTVMFDVGRSQLFTLSDLYYIVLCSVNSLAVTYVA